MIISKDTKVSEIYNYATKYNLRLTKEGLDNLTDYIIKANDAKYIYLFAKDINGLSKQNITDLTKAISKSESLVGRCNFAQYIKKLTEKDIDILIDAEINREKGGQLRFFACNIENITEKQIEKIKNAIIKSSTPYGIYSFILDVNEKLSKKDISDLEDALILGKDAKYIYKYAKEGVEANIDKLVDGIIQTKDTEYIYKFVSKVNNLSEENINKLTNAIIASKDLQYIYKLIKISNKKDELIEIIIDSKDINYIRKLIYSNSLSDAYKFNTKIEKIILESKDNILIVKYLIWLCDIQLINTIFGNMDKFMLFCLINMEELSLDKEKIINIESEFKQIESVFDFNYVDDNAKDYIKNNLKF